MGYYKNGLGIWKKDFHALHKKEKDAFAETFCSIYTSTDSIMLNLKYLLESFNKKLLQIFDNILTTLMCFFIHKNFVNN